MDQPQTLRDLAMLGIPTTVIDSWVEVFNHSANVSYSDFPLTPLQASVLGHSATLADHDNLIISGPTSSGKTLIAQAIIAASLDRNPSAKTLYLVPLRALVTEKHKQFEAVLKDRVVVPLSADYPVNDMIFASGQWDVAVLVFDKLYRWLADPNVNLIKLLRDVQNVIVDELQILENEQRGEKLEVTLSFLQWYRHLRARRGQSVRPRIVAMIADEVAAARVSHWLDARVVPGHPVDRPVPLYEGWIRPDKKHVLYANAQQKQVLDPSNYPEGIARVFRRLPPTKNQHHLGVQLITRMVAQGLRVLVYVATKGQAKTFAMSLRKELPRFTIDPDLAVALNDLEESPVKDHLTVTLEARVGFHHGDMTRDERHIVEKGFLWPGDNPPVVVIVATSTLSMGVNLPADAVLLLDHHTFTSIGPATKRLIYGYDYERGSRPLTALEYRNFAGRAGRYRPNLPLDAFGISLLLSEEPHQGLISGLLNGKTAPLMSTLGGPVHGYHPHILTLLAAVTAIDSTQAISSKVIENILRTSYAYQLDEKRGEEMLAQARLALQDLQSLMLVGRTKLKGPGKALARYHPSYSTIKQLLALVRELPMLWPERRMELLYELLKLEELESEYPRLADLPDDPEKRRRLEDNLRKFIWLKIPSRLYSRCLAIREFVKSPMVGLDQTADVELLRFMRLALIWGWTEGWPIKWLQDSAAFPRLALGTLKQLAEQLSFYTGALRSLWDQTVPSDDSAWDRVSRQLWLFEHSIRHGVPVDVVPLPVIVAYSLHQQLTRATYMQTWWALGGWTDVRTLIGREKPDPLLHTSSWEKLQKALCWWAAKSAQFHPEEGNHVNVMFIALEDLAAGRYASEFTIGHESEPSPASVLSAQARIAEAGVDEMSYQQILERTSRQLQRHRLDNIFGLQALFEAALRRAPLRVPILAVRGTPLSSLLRTVQIGNEKVTIGLHPGKPNIELIRALLLQNGSVVICGEAPEQSITAELPSQLRLLMTVEALLAGSELVREQPRHLARLRTVLLSTSACIISPDDLFHHMFPSDNDP